MNYRSVVESGLSNKLLRIARCGFNQLYFEHYFLYIQKPHIVYNTNCYRYKRKRKTVKNAFFDLLTTWKRKRLSLFSIIVRATNNPGLIISLHVLVTLIAE